MATGHAAIAIPYAVKAIQPARLNQRSLLTSLIVREAMSKAEAK